MDEKSAQYATTLTTYPYGHPSPSTQHTAQQFHSSRYLSPLQSTSTRNLPPLTMPHPSPSMARHRRLHVAQVLQPWLPLILYGITSLGFVVAIALYKTEVFAGLDELAHYLQQDEYYGYAVLFCLIFLTTIPPVPLYSTLTVLSGYTFGAWTGAAISYCAALTGALAVFTISRTLLRETISRWLASTCTIRRVVRAIEKRPKLLFLIRLAPYPYNVMNCLLAASPTLTLRTYTICTALSLFKIIIHTSIGASIHSFRDLHLAHDDDTKESKYDALAHTWTVAGILLCIAIFVYLAVVARRAVDEELEDEEALARNSEETVSFLADGDLEANWEQPPTTMAQSPLSSTPVVSFRHDHRL